MESWTSTPENVFVHLPSALGEQKLDLEIGEPVSKEFFGFGACFNELGWKALLKAGPEARAQVMTALFSPDGECNFRYCRLPIGANDFAESWYSYDETEGDFALDHFSIDRDRRYIIPFLREAMRARGEALKLFASPWSPPTWLKFPSVYNFGRLVDDPRFHHTYADYFVRYVKAYGHEGFAIDAVHVQNEPNSDQKFPSCLWTGPQMRDFIRDHLGPAFASASLSTEIWIGTIERGDFNAWTGTILADPQAAAFIKGAGFQWAGKAAIQQTREAYPDLPMIQTESECGDGTNTWDQAHYVFDLIRHYLANGANAYVYWNMALEGDAMSTWGWKQNSLVTVDAPSGTVIFNPEFQVMRHFGRVVKPGASILATRGVWSANSVTVRNPDGRIGHVIRNPFSHTVRVSLEVEEGPVTVELPALSISSLLG